MGSLKPTTTIAILLVMVNIIGGQELYPEEQADNYVADGEFSENEAAAAVVQSDIDNRAVEDYLQDMNVDERAAKDDAPVVGVHSYFCGTGWYCCGGSCCPLTTSCVQGRCYNVTDVKGTDTESVCSKCDEMKLSITADNRLLELYLDGVQFSVTSLPNYYHWPTVKKVPLPAATKLIAVKSQDEGSPVGGLLASINNNFLLSNSAWKCTNTYYSNWWSTTFSDASWPSAIAYANNPDSSFHSGINMSPISTSAYWIWTNRYRYPSSDTYAYCRVRIPTNTCSLGYGTCTNLCQKQGKTCCHCDMLNNGPTQVCSCCPAGYRCCGPTQHMSYKCCPDSAAQCNGGTPGFCRIWTPAPTRGTCTNTPNS